MADTASRNAEFVRGAEAFPDIMEMRDVHVVVGGPDGMNPPQYHEDLQEDKFVADETKNWYFTVWKQGDPKKVPIITFHDLGLNGFTCFRTFFNHPDMQAVTKHFSIYHLTAPGQEESAPNWREGIPYPTMDDMADMIESFRTANGIQHFIGIGVGAGANILARYAIKYPSQVDALTLVNCTSRVAGWGEWTSQKWNNVQLRWRGMTNASLDYLMWNYFNKYQENRPDLVSFYRQHFAKNVNPTNLALFIDSFINRTDFNIYREGDPARRQSVPRITCRVLLIASSESPYYEETIQLNSRLYPETSEWLKIQDTDGFVLDEEPGKVAEAILLQLQGIGYAVNERRASIDKKSQY
ncbi:protein NDRG3-like [Paramacrobiotus metropolitanus]|uniref:protein NDRG3-like n=1 Tax=Paramacrobiotus metropolitanus TaxID=2943436 RepID=UPI0024458BBA|nr:protein NDRG3-like [Paramacrobiotus metropolitanus]XP_055356193.1 protein NDRG3-like [Paramacrobiotus metropolitanus]